MSELYIYLLVLLQFAGISNGKTNDNLLVETRSGTVKGKLVTGHTQKLARAFYGIPYAEPPIGKLRFKPPVPVKPWTDVFDATKVPLPCYQLYTKESFSLSKKLGTTIRRPWSEDCLTLCVWTPAVVPDDAPVMIYIHGGGFTTGTGVYPHLDMSTNAEEEATVYISLNYRLGAFGFLSLGSPEVPGNQGLMDQHLALKWIHEHIGSFGGKNDAIFFFGLEAGAASIGQQIILKENAGLFKTGILIDGSPTCSWAWHSKETAVKIAKRLSQKLHCDNLNTTAEVDCLQNANPEDILDAILLDDTQIEHFKPNIDGTFVKEQPEVAMNAGRMNNNTVITVTSLQAESMRFFNLNDDILEEPGPSLTVKSFREALKRGHLASSVVEEDAVLNWYLKKDCPMNGTEIRDAAVEVYSDGISACCIDDFLNYATDNGVLTYKVVFGIPDSRFPTWIGAHSTVMHHLISADTLNPKYKFDSQIQMMTFGVQQMAKVYLRKKAKEFEELVPLYNLKEQPYMFWKSVPTHLKKHRTAECVLWNQILPALKNRKHSC